MTTMRERLTGHGREIVLWYSGILFSQRLLPGILLMLAAMGSADRGVTSLVCALLMLMWGWLFEIPDAEIKAGGYCANAILFGLYLGNTFAGLSFLVLAAVAGSFLLFILTRALNRTLWNAWQLPVCSYPFVLTVFLFTFLCQAEEARFGAVFLKPMSYSGGRIDEFFRNPFALSLAEKVARELFGFVFSVGAIFFQKAFFPCLLATIGLVLTSRIMTVLAVLGYGVMRLFMGVFPFFCGGQEIAFGFNAVLIGIAIGGGFFVPGRKSLLLMAGSQCAGFLLGLFCLAATRITGGDWTALPFNLVVTGVLLALQGRNPQAKPMRPGNHFESPEEAVAYYRRYEERIFLRAIALPVFGRWKIVQGFNGYETHKECWRFGVDLAAVDEAGNRFRSTGLNLEDYFTVGAPVLSPVEGVVSAVWGEVDDNSVGNINLAAPWGNFVIIYSAGLYIGLYHLKKGSILVAPGQAVGVGTQVAGVGNSGRSALPHLHLQVQPTPAVGAENMPFLFQDLLVEEPGGRTFHPFFKPEAERVVCPQKAEDTFRLLWYPRNGERWHLERVEGGSRSILSWTFSYSLHGNVVATSQDGEEIEYHVGPRAIEVTRFGSGGVAPLNLFALSLSEMPFALEADLRWKTVLFGRNAHPFLDPVRRGLAWVVGDLFSAECRKTVREAASESGVSSGSGLPETGFVVVSSFDRAAGIGIGLEVHCRLGPAGFLAMSVRRDGRELLSLRKVTSE